MGVVGAQGTGAVFESLPMQSDGFVEPAGCLVGAGEVVACDEGGGVMRAENAGAALEGLLVQGDGLVESAGRLVGAGERAT